MTSLFTRTTMALALIGAAATANAEGWTLDGANSKLAFGSVKNHYVGESHSFTDLSGGVDANGAASVEVALGSVQTNIDIRNERMIEHVFANAPAATLTASIDLAAMEALPVGGMTTMLVEGDLNLLGNAVPLDVNMFAVRLADNKILVSTDDLVYFAADEAGIDAGIDVLKELAGLDDITRAVPVSMRLVFDAK